ncbi:MAG: tetratricopeptide repeat protein, partial [Myxococcota bacterium]|nr:tetratricopeptide repeat protein [Myxococcota bacterium]
VDPGTWAWNDPATQETTDLTLAPTMVMGNLGPPLDHFVGRESELAELKQLYSDGARLVTLKGVGGAGKTRVSRRHARTVMSELKGGAWFVDLTESRSLLGLVHAAAEVLDVPLAGGDDVDGLVTRVGQALAARGPALIVLDNFEQVVEHAPTTVGRWLELAPRCSFLVSSREPLRLAAEQVFPIRPLPQDDGVTLFELRARSAGARWNDSEETSTTIHRIVERLDGIPLAIELAAARARMMSPAQILDRLAQQFDLLRGGRRGDAARQATLRSLIDWSWDLLEPCEKSALAQLSVFRDGFDMAAAEAVLDLEAWPDAPWSLDVIGSLLDKSLIHSREVLGQPRFDMYVSIQEYAAEKLAQTEETGTDDARIQAQRRHASWFAHLGSSGDASAPDPHVAHNVGSRFHGELDNLIVATRYGTGETAGRCCILAIGVFTLKGPVSAGEGLASQVLARLDLPPRLRMRIELARSRCLRIGGRLKEASATDLQTERDRVPYQASGESEDPLSGEPPVDEASGSLRAPDREGQQDRSLLEADRLMESAQVELAHSNYDRTRELLNAALEIYRRQGHRPGEADAFNRFGHVHYQQGRLDEATEHYQRAIDIHRKAGNRRREGHLVGNLGLVHLAQGKLDLAMEHFERALHITREVGDKIHEGCTLGNLSTGYQAQGRSDKAIEHYQLAIDIHRQTGNRPSEGTALGNLGNVHRARGDLSEAMDHFQSALEIFREAGETAQEAVFMGNLGDTLLDLGRME